MEYYQVLVLCVALFSAIGQQSAGEDSVIIKPSPDTPCPILLQSVQCLTLSEYSHNLRDFSPNTSLKFLPGWHNLDRNITVSNVTNFVMLPSAFSSSSHADLVTIISCIGPATLSFQDSQEVRLQGIVFIHCGDTDQPAIMVSSVQYFEMTECSLKDSRSVGMLANESVLALHTTSFHNSSHTGLIVMNVVVDFTSNTLFERNGNMFQNIECFAGNSITCAGGFAAVNSSIQILGIPYSASRHSHTDICTTAFRANSARGSGGALLLYNSTLTSNCSAKFAENTAIRTGGGIGAIDSSLEFFGDIILEDNSAGRGGGMFIDRSNLVCCRSVKLMGNRADHGGGIFAASSTTVSFNSGVLFEANNASAGGGMYILNSSMSSDSYSAFVNNTVVYNGGGFAAVGSHIALQNISLVANSAEKGGGGVSIDKSCLTFNAPAVFEMNRVGWVGGGIFAFANSSIMLYGSVDFIGNTAHQGGGIAIMNSNLIFNGMVLFDKNQATTLGGGIVGFGTSFTFHGRTTFTANTAGSGGGGMSYTEVCFSF